MQRLIVYLLLIGFIFSACSKEELPKRTNELIPEIASGWTVPIDQLVLSQLPPDRIRSIDDPIFHQLSTSDLQADETALVYRYGNTVKVYPQEILWHHEIINDQIGDHYFAITFCPLTGSAVAWDREINGEVTEFGVSGHLFNENLISYDRNSQSYWSQMQMKGIKGMHAGDELEPLSLLTTSGSTIQAAFPDALVLVDTSAYVCDSLCTGSMIEKGKQNIIPKSTMIENTDYFGIVRFGIAKDPRALLFNYEMFGDSIDVIQTHFMNSKVIVAGSQVMNFIIAFIDQSGDPSIQFYPVQNQLPAIFADNQGNYYDITGMVVLGSQKGKRLPSPPSYFSHNFAWDLFFGQNITIFEMQ